MKFLLSLCFLLASGYGQLHAHGFRDAGHHRSIEQSPSRTLESADQTACFGAVQLDPAFIIQTSPTGSEIPTFRLSIPLFENEGADELFSSKKNVESNHYITSVFFAQTLGHFFTPFCKSISYTRSYRYLIFQVFRI